MRRFFIALGVLVIAGVLWYGLSPLLRNKTLNEEIPGTLAPQMKMDERLPTGESQTDAAVSQTVRGPFPITDTLAHPASGSVKIIDAGGSTYVRYEDFKTINGPDVYVYLSKDIDAKEFVSLGRLKATEGNINYEVPEEVSVDEYSYVLVWCKAFGVLFNSAKIR